MAGGQSAVSLGELIRPTAADATVTGGAPQIVQTDHKLLQPTAASVSVTGGVPSIPRLGLVASGNTTGSTVTIPSHQIGDIIVLYAHSTSGTDPSIPAAGGTVPTWTSIDLDTGDNFGGSAAAYCVATATNTTSGNWGATQVMGVAVLRGQAASPIGGHGSTFGTSSTDSIAPAVTLVNADGTSILLHFLTSRGATIWNAAPAGYTAVFTASQICLLTKDNTTTDGSVTRTHSNTGASGGHYMGQTIEIISS